MTDAGQRHNGASCLWACRAVAALLALGVLAMTGGALSGLAAGMVALGLGWLGALTLSQLVCAGRDG